MKLFIAFLVLFISGWFLGHPLNYDITKQWVVVQKQEWITSQVEAEDLKEYSEWKLLSEKRKLNHLKGIKYGFVQVKGLNK